MEGVAALIVWCDGDAGKGIAETLPLASPAHGIVALILMEEGGKGEDHQIIANGFVGESAPIVSSEAVDAVAKLRVRLVSLSQQRGDAYEDKRRVVEAVPGGDAKGSLGGGRR